MGQMKVRTKLLVSFVALNMLCAGLITYSVYSEMRPHFLEAVEYTLIDMSRVMASEIAARAEKDPSRSLDTEALKGATEKLFATNFPSRNDFDAGNRSSLQIYVTDEKGAVLFDSNGGAATGQDFSQWRDVALTLQGKYGARATRSNPRDPRTSTHYVAAPIQVNGRIVGVVSIGKPVESVNGFIGRSKLRIITMFLVSALASLVVSFIAAFWISRPVQRLSTYVSSLGSAAPQPFPSLPADEIGALGNEFETIRQELEGKKYVEKYVHDLTHEIKAPLTGILGAAELLNSDGVEEVDRRQLLGNVKSEARRLHDIAERLLELASLEARDRKIKREDFDLSLVLEEVVESFEIAANARKVKLVLMCPDGLQVAAERFLLWRAAANLVQNAIDFSNDGGVVEIEAKQDAGGVTVSVSDRGVGIPEYALARVKERFFSLERPTSGKKSSGLGLSFVAEVMRAHGGRFDIGARPDGPGTTASLWF
ncbi:MAG: two-component system sensor histidine kinase CreC [Bdellovibrionota bacterium]